MTRHSLYTTRTPRVHRISITGFFCGSVLLSLLTTPVVAQTTDVFGLPAGCDAFLTVQSKDCTVDHHFFCEGDPVGHKQRVTLDEDGIIYLGTTDSETQWVRSFHPRSQHSQRLEDDPVDRASFRELTELGVDTYDFKTLSDEIGTTRFVGMDQLTGRIVTIDGVDLEETEYQITAYDEDGEMIWSSKGNEYISRDWNMFLAGPGTVTLPTETYDEDDSPVEFILPGEAGFQSANPKHGCGVVLSKSPVDQLKEFLDVDDL